MTQTSFLELVQPTAEVVNVASVPQRSPFRYPGGKTWLIPVVRQWLQQDKTPAALVEPFAGGGIVSLTAAFESLAKHIHMVELDPDIAAVWKVIFSKDNQWLADEIMSFKLSHSNAAKVIDKANTSTKARAFSTIVRNRINHGGIITKGSGALKNGENGKGIASRWYPETLYKRITAIQSVQQKVTFKEGNAFDILKEHQNEKNFYFFIDPPYTVAGKRLYTFFDIDHEGLFAAVAKLKGRFMLTYDDTEEIRELALKYKLPFKTIPMKTTHHLLKQEIIVTDNLDW
jgi:DNA adenine methylase